MIVVTKSAQEAIKQASDGITGFFRLGVIPGGCSGLQYSMSWDKIDLQDSVERFENGGLIIMDQESERLLRGATLDHSVVKGFIIDNPNATRGCGCGSSFNANP